MIMKRIISIIIILLLGNALNSKPVIKNGDIIFHESMSSQGEELKLATKSKYTHMGIIYIIYGPPNDVYKSEEIIDWVYNRDLTMTVVRFSFYKVKNVLRVYFNGEENIDSKI